MSRLSPELQELFGVEDTEQRTAIEKPPSEAGEGFVQATATFALAALFLEGPRPREVATGEQTVQLARAATLPTAFVLQTEEPVEVLAGSVHHNEAEEAWFFDTQERVVLRIGDFAEVSALKIKCLPGFSSQQFPKYLLQDTTSELYISPWSCSSQDVAFLLKSFRSICSTVPHQSCKFLDGPIPDKTSKVAARKIPHLSCKILDGHVLHKTSFAVVVSLALAFFLPWHWSWFWLCPWRWPWHWPWAF